jgi:FlaA1/EpsC-like NDP-sugar epimerase
MKDPITIATGRHNSLFAEDMMAYAGSIRETLEGKRILVIGGAGSIGAATVRALLSYEPGAVHVIDQNENALAELVRDVRGAGLADSSVDLRLAPLDYGASVTRRFLDTCGPYNVVLHFAALKHVRSEKDVASILQMFDTNVLKQKRFMGWLTEAAPPARYFAVSTDKAANPANFMGASKRVMEHLLFTNTVNPLGSDVATSARFANVAFSAGSLLASFADRIRRRQPLPVPKDTRRFFISPDEAAQICLLAAAVVQPRHLAIPRTGTLLDLRDLTPIGEAFLRAAGYEASHYEDERLAREAVDREASNGSWPLLITPRDTDGEKEGEQFLGDGETSQESGFTGLLSVSQTGADPTILESILIEFSGLLESPSRSVTKADLGRLLSHLLPEFRPIQSGRTLDDRM